MKYLNYMEVEPSALGCFFDYQQKTISKGQRNGHQRMTTKYILTELWPGAWECYYPCLQGRNYLLTTLHLEYLETREKCMQDGDPTYLRKFKKHVAECKRTYRLNQSQILQYLRLDMDTITDVRTPRIKMDALQ